MKFKALLLALALVSITTATVSAQTVCTENRKDCDRKECKSGMNKAFEGITLTAEQQTALDKIYTDRATKAKEARCNKQKADSTARMARRQAKLDYLHQVQKVLTPEQYVTFLENQIVNGPSKMHKKGFRGDKNKKDFKGKDRKIKGERPARR